jgi:hypothetical protein
MRTEVEDALREACEEYLGDGVINKPARANGGKRRFIHRLKAFLRELPDDISIIELREELDDAVGMLKF